MNEVSYERIGTKTRFKKEAKGYLEGTIMGFCQVVNVRFTNISNEPQKSPIRYLLSLQTKRYSDESLKRKNDD